ncbi:hypothetical protein AUP07_1344 [methanogenic archaeon mixed culture ISO4-G1]|nr:hypothetical protein AUP07_1344 [methanogenic archaeon mixed culture ISO4-G1]
MNMSIAWTLRIGIVLGLILIVIGEFLEPGNQVLYYGLLVLIASPMFAVIAALIGLIRERDWFWALIAVVVLVIVISGAILAAL